MKKDLIFASLFLILFGCLISCSNQENDKNNELYESIVNQVEIYDFDVEHYNDDKINSIETNIKQLGMELNGGLSKVSRYSKESKFGEITYVYIYKFEFESDAYIFNQEYPKNYNPKEFFCIGKSDIVVFGNFEEITSLSI